LARPDRGGSIHEIGNWTNGRTWHVVGRDRWHLPSDEAALDHFAFIIDDEDGCSDSTASASPITP
jgi:hypothetical protein